MSEYLLGFRASVIAYGEQKMARKRKTVRTCREEEAIELVVKTLMKQGGLSEFDYEPVRNDAEAVVRALKRKGYFNE